MRIVKQLSLFLENKPGALAAVTKVFARQKINIYALSVSDAVDHSVVRMVVSDANKAIHLLGEHGVMVVERNVIMVEGRSEPGELAEIARKLARAKVNIEYAYTATPPGASNGIMILRVNEMKKARKTLKGH
jgi:hypothetical protein